MGPGKKLRTWLGRRRAQQQPSPASQSPASSPPAPSSAAAGASVPLSPASAQASTSSTAPAPVSASGSSSQPRSRSQPMQPTPALASTLFPFIHVVERPGASEKASHPRLVYVSVSSDLRLIHADSQSTKPTSLIDFRAPDFRLPLTRMAYEQSEASATSPSLEAVVAPRARPEAHPTGPAVRIADKKRSILLISATEEERDTLLLALRLRIAPWEILREQMEAEMREGGAPSASASSLAVAARELLSGAENAAGTSASATSGPGCKGAAGMAKFVWEKAGTVAQTSLWVATFGQGLGGVVRTAEELEKLAKPLGGLTVVGCAFSVVALSARAVSLMSMEREGRDRLSQAREDLREASLWLVGWLFSILSSGFNDEDGLVGTVFDVLGECWNGADDLEQYILRNWARRAWSAEDIGHIVDKVDSLKGKLMGVGLLNVAAKHERRIEDHDRRIVDIEGHVSCVDAFIPYAPNAFTFDVGLVENVATSLVQLKAAVLPTFSPDGETDVVDSNESSSDSGLRRIALISIYGEGGVGKTSTCKLLCVDEDVRTFFSGGAILWLDVGKDATEEKVKGELRRALLSCGGGRSAELMMPSTCGVEAAVGIAQSFFAGHRVLVIADNIWETPTGSIVTSWAEMLSKIVSGPGCAVIATTRFSSLSKTRGFSGFTLGRLDLSAPESPGWSIAENLYDALMNEETKVQSSNAYKKSRRRSLVLSCGLPLGITTIAGLVQSYCEVGDNVDAVLSKIEQKVLGLVDKVVGEDLKASTGHPGLFAAMEESLSYLDMRERKYSRVKPMPLSMRNDVHGKDVRAFSSSYDAFVGQSFSARYSALEMMLPSSTSISFPLLCLLWHVPSIDDAKSIARVFVNIGLGRIEVEVDAVFILHDLQYAFCARTCERSTGATIGAGGPSLHTVNGHALFLSSCESLLQAGPEVAGADDDMGFVQFCFGDAPASAEELLRRYLPRNLFRHLRAGARGTDADGVRRAIMSILSDYRWLRGRIVGDGRASSLMDCANALATRSCVISSSHVDTMLLNGGAEKSIRALQQMLMLVGEGVSLESDGMLAGSLIEMCQSSVGFGDAGMDAAFLTRLALSSESGVRGSWLKPICGCPRERDQGVLAQAVVGIGGTVYSLAALGDGVHFVSGSEDGVLRVHDSVSLQAVLELKEHTAWVTCVDVVKKEGVEDYILLFSGSYDGTVRCWKVGLDPVQGLVEEASAVVGDCDKWVSCLAVSKGGDLIVAGCAGMVFIWQRKGADATFGFELVTAFKCLKVEKVLSLEDMGRVTGVVVSESGDLVVAGDKTGAIAFWSKGGSGIEGTVYRFRTSSEINSDLLQVLLSDDESYVNFIFGDPATCEVWDVSSRTRRSPRVAISEFEVLTCAEYGDGQDAFNEGSGERGVLVAGGFNDGGDYIVSLYSICSDTNDLKVLSTYPLTSTPVSVCYTSFGGSRRIIAGSDDGCVRMLDAGVPVTYRYEGGVRSSEGGSSEAPDARELGWVLTVAVMPIAGFVVCGHKDGKFSVWRAESGQFVSSFEDVRGELVRCVDISADEGLAVSGHINGVVLVWDASNRSKWECRFVLQGRRKVMICTTISADAKRIVTVDLDGEMRVWDAETGGAALLTIETGLKLSIAGCRGAISLDGGLFLWAINDFGDGNCRKWEGKLVDIGSGSLNLKYGEGRNFDWEAFFKQFDGKEEVKRLRFGGLYCNRSVELRDAADVWRISSGDDERGTFLPRINCELRPADGRPIDAAASLGFGNNVYSIATDWMPMEAGSRRRAIVACELRGKSVPAILHFYPNN